MPTAMRDMVARRIEMVKEIEEMVKAKGSYCEGPEEGEGWWLVDLPDTEKFYGRSVVCHEALGIGVMRNDRGFVSLNDITEVSFDEVALCHEDLRKVA